MSVYTLAEINMAYPIEFNIPQDIWVNFVVTTFSNYREHKDRIAWIGDIHKKLKEYNVIKPLQGDNVIRFKTEADLTLFLLRFS